GRTPERPRRSPLLADVVAILGAMSGVGGLVVAVRTWVYGVLPHSSGPRLGSTLLVAFGLLLLSPLAPLSMAIERDRRALAADEASVISAWRFVLGKWWETVRLVLLLAVGPGLVALALATAHRAPPAVSKVTALAGGGTVMISTDSSG